MNERSGSTRQWLSITEIGWTDRLCQKDMICGQNVIGDKEQLQDTKKQSRSLVVEEQSVGEIFVTEVDM